MTVPPISTEYYDVIVIGSGAAGLGLALSLAAARRVLVLTKEDLLVSASQHAQGGIAAVMSAEDSLELHVADTLRTGGGLSDPDVTAFMVKNARQSMQWLTEQGVAFTCQSGGDALHLNQEGGHQRRRILHVADRTGSAVVATLAEQVLASPQITCHMEHTAVDILMADGRAAGVLAWDNQAACYRVFQANQLVIATGGASSVYPYTSHPGQTTGDGIAMAWRVGARVADLEFQQFHPTCFYHPEQTFLITEAMRGEGAYLVLPNGKRFMPEYDPRAELAPRDVVTRAIHAELKRWSIPCVYLDIRHRPADFVRAAFPTIDAMCRACGVDITAALIPVVPAAHYTCGGVVTNCSGQTDVPGLYVIGESACTGLHGANRLASNSLLECLVMAQSAALAILSDVSSNVTTQGCSEESVIAPALPQAGRDACVDAIVKLRSALQALMWDKVGVVRSCAGLQAAEVACAQISAQVAALVAMAYPTRQLFELRNLVQVAARMIAGALARTESRGLHYNIDYPVMHETALHTVQQGAETLLRAVLHQ